MGEPSRTPVSTSTVLLALILAAALVVPEAASANGIETEEWRTIETEHFEIHYHEGVAAIAPEVAEMCEQAHLVLAPLFDYEPAGRTQVVLLDEADAANGSATVLPKNLMRLFGMPPEEDSVLGDYSNWMWALIVHEYTHILHIDTMGRAFRWLNIPLGKMFAPNQLLPRWLIEGLATYQETARTSGGRVRSSLFEAYLRMAVLEDALPTLGQLSGSPLDWPGGTGAYLYGSHFVTYVADTRGWDTLLDFIQRYGRRMIPYGLNITAEQTVGDDIVTLWNEWHAHVHGRALAQAMELELAGVVRGQELTSEAEGNRYLAVSPTTGRPLFLRNSGEQRRALVDETELLEAGTGLEMWIEDASVLSFFPDGATVVVGQRTAVDGYYVYSDLWRVGLEDGSFEQLTYGARAREPTVSPDGERIVFVSPFEGRTELRVLELETGEIRTVFEHPPWSQTSNPTFVSDHEVVASYHEERGGRDLIRVDIDTGDWERLTHDAAMDLSPSLTPDGEHVVFSSDRSGIFDVYALRLSDGEIRRLTRVYGGAFQPHVGRDADGRTTLYYSSYSSIGYNFSAMPLDEAFFDAGMQPPVSYERPTIERPDVSDVHIGEPRRYRLFVEARPRRWSPQVTVIGDEVTLGVTFAGIDPAGIHGFTFAGLWDVDDARWTGGMTYFLNRFYPTLSLNLARLNLQRNRSLVGQSEFIPFVEDRWLATTRVSVPLRNYETTHVVAFDYSVDHRGYLEEPVIEHRPEDIEPRFPELGWFNSVGVSWSWGEIRAFRDAISAEQGTSLSVGGRLRAPALGAEVHSAESSFTVRHYARMPWLDHHVMALRLTGGLSVSNMRVRRVFRIGGLSGQDVLVALNDEIGAPTRNVRGYEPGIRGGDRFYLANLEYRFPIWNADVGLQTLPLWLGRVHGAVFADFGNAYDGVVRFEDTLTGLGGELRFSSLLGYFRGASIRVGLARGLGSPGITHFYFLAGSGF